MTLRVSGRPITLGPLPNIIGDRPVFEQQATELWCWAACVEMMLRHHNASPDTQCQVGQKGLLLINQEVKCCTAQNEFNHNPSCRKDLPRPEITALWKLYEPNISVCPVGRKLKDEEFQDETRQKHHVEMGFQNSATGHVVIGYGWAINDGELWFYMHDPEVGQDVRIRASAIDTTGRGRWRVTWVISKP